MHGILVSLFTLFARPASEFCLGRLFFSFFLSLFFFFAIQYPSMASAFSTFRYATTPPTLSAPHFQISFLLLFLLLSSHLGYQEPRTPFFSLSLSTYVSPPQHPLEQFAVVPDRTKIIRKREETKGKNGNRDCERLCIRLLFLLPMAICHLHAFRRIWIGGRTTLPASLCGFG